MQPALFLTLVWLSGVVADLESFCNDPSHSNLFTCIFFNKSRQGTSSSPINNQVTSSTTSITTSRPDSRPDSRVTSNARVSSPNLDIVITELNQLLDRETPLVAVWVQLGFHSCIGGCDGCLDTNSVHNKGLKKAYEDLRQIHNKHASIISLPDLLALAATQAAKKGLKKAVGRDVDVPFQVGRSTCANPDVVNKVAEFPEGRNPNAIGLLEREFGLTRREAIAAIGAHSLGRCSANNSGFSGPWDFSEDKLDNAYYRSLRGTLWVAGRSPGGSTQWNARDNSRMMLHADMALLRKFTVSGPQDTPSCSRSVDCEGSDDERHVNDYANNQELFIRDFVAVYVKILEHTNDALISP